MKTKEDIQAKLDYLKITLDLAVKDLGDTRNNFVYATKKEKVISILNQINLLEWVLEN